MRAGKGLRSVPISRLRYPVQVRRSISLPRIGPDPLMAYQAGPGFTVRGLGFVSILGKNTISNIREATATKA